MTQNLAHFVSNDAVFFTYLSIFLSPFRLVGFFLQCDVDTVSLARGSMVAHAQLTVRGWRAVAYLRTASPICRVWPPLGPVQWGQCAGLAGRATWVSPRTRHIPLFIF